MELSAADLRAAADGDPAAVDALIVAYGPTVLRWCARLGGPRIDAEDAAQDVLERVLRKLHGLGDPATFPAWLFTTCRGVIAQHRRRAWFRRWVGEPDAATADPARPRDPDVGRVHDVLERLPGELREVLVLCDLEERPAPEVAVLVGVPEGTVRSRLRRARAEFGRVAREMELDWVEVPS
jgi:RNA polymerase sigma-70 factor (ECF subfamily)